MNENETHNYSIGDYVVVDKISCITDGKLYENQIDWLVAEIKDIIFTLTNEKLYKIYLYIPILTLQNNNNNNNEDINVFIIFLLIYRILYS